MSGAEVADESQVKRRSINVIKARLEDIVVGDVVNRKPDAESGWFEVHAVSTLFNGDLQLADESEQQTVSGNHKDMVGLQLVEEVDVDENGVIIPAVPVGPLMAAPAPAPAPSAPAPAPQSAAPDLTVPVLAHDPVDDAAVAATVATEMPGTVGRAPGGVDLGLVASLLEDLDVGEAPTITTAPNPTAPAASPAPLGSTPLPANAVAVDGGALPEQPSYKNPVVVPEGTMLPRRSRAA